MLLWTLFCPLTSDVWTGQSRCSPLELAPTWRRAEPTRACVLRGSCFLGVTFIAVKVTLTLPGAVSRSRPGSLRRTAAAHSQHPSLVRGVVPFLKNKIKKYFLPFPALTLSV